MNPKGCITREFPLPFLTQEGLVAMTPSAARASQPKLTREHRLACFAKLLADLIRQRVQERKLVYIAPSMHIGAGAGLVTADQFILPATSPATSDGVDDQAAGAAH